MAKDKVAKNNLSGAKNILQKGLFFVNGFVEKIITKIDALDPAENTRQRVISALILVPVAIDAICFSQNLFFLIVIAITILMTAEWIELIKKAEDQKKWRLIGLFYILIPMFCVLKLRLHDTNILLWMFAVIWATDIFAFFSGKVFGGVKLAPSISPNKTWAGLAGGVIASMLIGFLSAFMFRGGIVFFVFFSIVLAVIEQLSDLL